MALSKIEWTDYTFNPWRGCTKVSDGCKNCYAETWSIRNHKVFGEWGPNGKRVIAPESYWKQPIKWNKEAAAAGQRRRVFCASLADVFEDRPELEEPRDRLFALIDTTPNLDWLLLTKRPEFMLEWLRHYHGPTFGLEWFTNLWLGVSVENQATADERIPQLLQIPAAVRFLSIEPLLGPVDLSSWLCADLGPGVCDLCGLEKPFVGDLAMGENSGFAGICACLECAPSRIDWVIVGGESGPHARPMHPDWARSLRDQCAAANVPFFFKQWGEWVPFDHAPDPSEAPYGCAHTYVREDGGPLSTERPWENAYMLRVGKAAAGHVLDGATHQAFPAVCNPEPRP